jgi:hypothetical protein
MLENGKVLGYVLINLIEGFEEDPEIMKKLQETILKQERSKNEGEGGEEGDNAAGEGE